jgi:hypothetical protein
MKRDSQTAPAAGDSESRTGKAPSLSPPPAGGKDLPAGAHRASGESLPSALAALSAFRQSLALLDS